MTTSRPSVFTAQIPTLPSGYSGLPRELVVASQRQRLIHGVTMAVAEKALSATTISDIVERANVSKKTFYEHFPDRLACFLAAYDHGAAAILTEVRDASAAAHDAGLEAVEQYRAGTRAYLTFMQRETPYARTFFLEMPAAGAEATARHLATRRAFADQVGRWHARSRGDRPDWPAVTAFHLEAATGLVHEVANARIAAGAAEQLLQVLDDVVDASLRVLEVPSG